MSIKLKTQIENTDEVRTVLKRLECSILLPDGSVVETFLIHLPCKNNACDTSELLKLIKDVLFMHFSLSISRIEDKLNLKSKITPKNKNELFIRLFKEAIDNSSQHTAKGELGELLLFALLEAYFNAPKILTKMSLKTNPRMPYHSYDAVHAQFIDDHLRLYLGEAKLHKTFASAKNGAIASLSEHLNDKAYENEFNLIDRFIDFKDMSDKNRKLILDLIDPFSDNHNKGSLIHMPCFIGFSDPNLFGVDSSKYVDEYINNAKKQVKQFYSSILNAGLSPEKTPLMLLPFSCIDSFVAEFIAYIGIKQ